MKLDILGALDLAMISIIMSFLFVNLFDTTGTLLGVATRAKLIDDYGNTHNLDKALKADSGSSIFGTFLAVHLLQVMWRVLRVLKLVEEQV